MFDLVLAVAMFVLTVAMVGLFAMMGELASRIPHDDRDVPPQPIEHVTLNVTPTWWLGELADLQRQDFATVVVLSTSCGSCQRIASGATGDLELPANSAVVVSAPSAEVGDRFIEQNPMLRRYPHLVDPGGTWLTENLGVDISPSVLTFRYGRLTSAHTFSSAPVLAEHFRQSALQN